MEGQRLGFETLFSLEPVDVSKPFAQEEPGVLCPMRVAGRFRTAGLLSPTLGWRRPLHRHGLAPVPSPSQGLMSALVGLSWILGSDEFPPVVLDTTHPTF